MDSTEILRFTNNENGNWIEKSPLPKALTGLRGAILYGYFRVFGGRETDEGCFDGTCRCPEGKCSKDVITWNHLLQEWMIEKLSIDSTVFPHGISDHAVTEASFTELKDFCK